MQNNGYKNSQMQSGEGWYSYNQKVIQKPLINLQHHSYLTATIHSRSK